MNRDQLVQALRQVWRAIPDAVIGRCTNSGLLAYLHMMDIHATETCSLWSNVFTFIMSGPI